MGNYSKLIGSVLGGAIGILATFGLPTEWATPEVTASIATIGAAVLTYFFPANKPA